MPAIDRWASRDTTSLAEFTAGEVSTHLYGFYRSSAAYRVRIALNLKGLDYDMTSVHLRDGDQFDPDYVKLNLQAQVPTLVLDDGTPLVQSPAIAQINRPLQSSD